MTFFDSRHLHASDAVQVSSGEGFESARRLNLDPYLTVDDQASLRGPTTAITVACWVKFTDAESSGSAFNAVVDKVYGTASPWLSYAIQTGSTPFRYRFRISNGTTLFSTVYTDTLPDDEWLYLAGTWQSGSTMRLRVWQANGTLLEDVESASTVTTTIGYADEALRIGRAEGVQPIDADLAGPMIADAVVADTPLAAHRDYGTVPGDAVAAWDFDGTDPETDLVGSADLTVVGQAAVASGPHDTAAPAVSSAASDVTSDSTATVSWTTVELATSVVEYGLTDSYGGSASNVGYTTDHSVNLSGLTDDTTYHYRIVTTDTAGNVATGTDQTFTTDEQSAPSAPTGLSAFGGDGTVTLNWNDTPGADTYNVLRSTTSGSGHTEIADEVAVSNYEDGSVTNDTPYFYVVEAVNTTGTSAQSAEASATPTGATDLDSSWESMVAGMTFTSPNYEDNCETFAAWYAANTGYDTDGWTSGDLDAADLDVRGQGGGTEASPQIIEGKVGGPARWDASWITFRHCLINNFGTYAAYATPTLGGGYTGIRFENCTFLESPPTERDCTSFTGTSSSGDYFGMSFYRCDIAGYSGGLKSYGGMWAKYVYIHDMYPSSSEGQHVTCSTARRGRHHLIRCMGTDGGSGVFNVYHEGDTSDLLFEENICIGMSPNASASYAFDNNKGSDGFVQNSEGMVWRNNMVGKYTNPPEPENYAGIQYGPFSSTDNMVSGDGESPGEYLAEGNFFIEDGSSW